MATKEAVRLSEAKLKGMRLAYSSHPDRSNGLCAMEVVAWMAGEPHSDRPKCASPVIAAVMRSLNDWLNDDDRQVLKPYLPKLLNTAGSKELELRRAFRAADYAVRVIAPLALRSVGLKGEAVKLIKQLAAAIERIKRATLDGA